ncbi:MAG TPA: NAD-dependent epimerase/dehydratase family protein [Thermoleophilaceae bacterium]
MSDLSVKRVLVTGGGGFVGAPTVRALDERGANVRVLDLAAPQQLADLPCEVLIGDVGDAEIVARACDGCERVVHLAVLPLTRANAAVTEAFEANVRGSFNVFRAAGESGAKKVVYSSASSAYGPTDAVPIREEHPLRPTAFYPASKAAGELLLRGLAGTYGFSFTILRYMNVYGPGQRAGVVPAVTRALLANQRPKLIGDGSQAFDFVHIQDCALANLLALESDVGDEDFNVGCGEATSLNELVATLSSIVGVDVEPEYSGDAVTVPPRVGDPSKSRDLLGFEARIPLREGLVGVVDELRAAEPAGRPG